MRSSHGLLALLLTGSFLIPASPAHAHLALLRQGYECGDVPNTDDKFGSTFAVGDFDKDGYEDLATAATWEANGLINTAAHGIVHINYGTSLGLTHTGSQILSPGDPGDPSIKYGSALASADFNGDGYDDLAVGAPDMDFMGTTDAGAVFIYDGFNGGIQTGYSALFFQSDAGALNEAYDNFGWSLTAGDFNGDGFADLAVGGIGENSDMGAVYVFYSTGVGGLSSVGADIFTPNSTGFSGPEVLGGWYGYALASADFDDDGFDELVIGAPRTDVNAVGNSGRVYFLYGAAAGITTLDNWALDTISTGSAMLDATSELGWSLCVGHFMDKPQAAEMQVVAGAPAWAHAGQPNAGSVIWFTHDDVTRGYGGSMTRLTQELNLSYDDVHSNDRFGHSVAAGRFDQNLWDDLAVGVLSDDIEEQSALGQQSGSGSVYLWLTSLAGWNDPVHIRHTTLNDHVMAGDQLGEAVVFGRFDGSGRDNLAVGAPGGDYPDYEGGPTTFGAGRAYIHAPWRQARNRPHRGSAAFDCNNRLVYSQRAWQRLRPASTTKTMTLQLACDAIQSGQDPNQWFQVPAWVANNVGGSQAGLVPGEQLTFSSLIKTMMTVSGNDSAMFLGGIMSGQVGAWNGWEGTSPAFAASMEAKANQLGLSGATSMTNAAGIDAGDHYVTPYDWAKLAYETIQDPCVKDMVNTSPWVVTRIIPPGFFNNFLQMAVPMQFQFVNGFVNNVKSNEPSAVGTKGGQTPGALRTGVYAANPAGPGGYTAASGFGVWDDDDPFPGVNADCNSCVGAELLTVANSICQGTQMPDDITTPPAPPTPWGTLTAWEPVDGGTPTGLGFQIGEDDWTPAGRITQIDMFRANYTNPTARYRQAILRTSEICLASDQSEDWGVAPYQGHNGFRVINRGANTVDLLITASDPLGFSQNVTLATDQEFVIAPASGNPAPSFLLTIQNLTLREDACIEVDEMGYLYEIELGDGLAIPDVSSIALTRALDAENENVQVFLEGLDPMPGNLLDLSAHDSNSPTPVEEGPTPGAPKPAVGRLLPNHPNPFNPSTTLRFDLERAGNVDLAIYDVQGRLVRTLATAQYFDRGRHQLQWNGDDDASRRVSSGVYYLRMRAGGTVDSHRLVLVK